MSSRRCPMTRDRVRMARIALACLVEPGNRDLALLIDECGPIDALDRAVRGDVTKSLRGIVLARADGRDPYDIASDLLARTVRVGARVVTPDDDEWPRQLDDLRRISRDTGERVDQDVLPPVCLWLRGAPPLADVVHRSVAVVGARASTPYGNHISTVVSYSLAELCWSTVASYAYCTAAH